MIDENQKKSKEYEKIKRPVLEKPILNLKGTL
jgi:hypothetical protein